MISVGYMGKDYTIMTKVNMSDYGLSGRFVALAKEHEELTAARIISQEKGLYRIVSPIGEQFAEVSGKLRYNALSPSDFPAVGDFVMIDSISPDDHAVIHTVLPRKSVFLRKAAGTCNEEQVVAANIDTVFICMSLNNDFNIRRLERYLSVAWDSGASPVIVLTKSDLCDDIDRYLFEIESVAFGTDVIVTSAIEEDGLEKLLPHITAGKTVALMGSSGVGKSTLINCLLGEDRLDTNGLRNDDKGRHTTTRRELFLLKNGGMVMDTPGMRELGLWDAENGLSKSFSDIEELASMCRFHDCTHTTEPHCAVRAAIERGELPEDRLRSYLKLKAETSFSEDSQSYLAEKKQKFKNIAKENKKNRR